MWTGGHRTDKRHAARISCTLTGRTFCESLLKDVGRRICAKSVLHSLTGEGKKGHRSQSAQTVSRRARKIPHFCKCTVTGGGPSCCGTILRPNIRARSGEEENPYWKPKSVPSSTRMLIYLPKNTEWCTVNLHQIEQRWRVNSIQRSWRGHWKEFRELGLKFERKELGYFVRQCPAHPTVTMKRFLANASAVTSQPPYTTVIAVAGLSYSLKWKSSSIEHFKTLRT
jgi:hypothetical protein